MTGSQNSEVYQGPLDLRRMSTQPQIKRAYQSYLDQRQRCYNSKNKRYRYSGARGITVEYGPREFITWWLEQIKTKKRWKRPTCGRIDHSKPYRFDNIRLEEQSDNTAERNRRWASGREEIQGITTCGISLRFRSIFEASRVTGINTRLIDRALDGTIEGLGELPIKFSYVGNRSATNP